MIGRLLRLFGRARNGVEIDLNALTPPPPARLADRARGEAIVAGRLVCARHEFIADRPGWLAESASVEALDQLHSFSWLGDLAAASGAEARARGRALVADWLAHGERRRPAEDASVTADRLVALLTHLSFLAPEFGDELRARLRASLARQIVAFDRRAGAAAPGLGRLRTARGLIYARLFAADESGLQRDLAYLEQEIALQFLSDGGHAARSPAALGCALEILLDIAAVLRAADRPSPSWLADAVDRAQPMLSFFLHGDGAAAAFNGVGGETWAALDALAGRDTATQPARAPQSGYVRLAANGALLIMDVGAPAASPFDRDAHAGALSFEFSHGRERVIVNCGAQQGATQAWRAAQRSTAAHSTATVDDTNSSELTAEGVGARRARVEWSYDSEDNRHWVTAQHDGYAANFGVTHHRRLFLAADGEDLRGEDRLSGAHPGGFAIRFHLHPSVKASLVHNGAAILLRAADGGAWRLQAAGAPLSLAESVYFGDPGPSRRSEQIVLAGRLTGAETVVKWALRRADPR